MAADSPAMPPPTMMTSRVFGSSVSAPCFMVDDTSHVAGGSRAPPRDVSLCRHSRKDRATERSIHLYDYFGGGGGGFFASAGFASADSPPGISASSGTAFKSASVYESGWPPSSLRNAEI